VWIGVDVLRSNELDALLARPWFRAYVYAPQELAVADSFGAERAREFLTGRFAAKEAVLKAIGTGVTSGVTFRQVVVLPAANGAPEVHLTGRAARSAGERGIACVNITITHKKGLVIAAAFGVPDACRRAHPADRAGDLLTDLLSDAITDQATA
jgi:holo-[acyl-carrier protein] synthase